MNDTQATRVEASHFDARDGRRLAATLYSPTVDNGRSVLINSATAVKRSYYDRYARFLAEQGFTVLTYDYRGIGDSRDRPLRNESGGMRLWGEADAAGAIDFLAQQRPHDRLLAVGHSAGGQLFGLAENNARVAGMLTVASQSGYWRLWPMPRRWLLAVLWFGAMPGLTALLGYFPSRPLGMGSVDLPPGVAREWARWCRHPDYIVDDAGVPLRQHFEDYAGSILAHAISDDWMAPRAAVEALHGFYRSARVEFRDVTPRDAGVGALGHFGYFRESGRALWPAGADWLLAQ